MKIAFITLGCPKNEVDTEIMQGLLEREGLELVDAIKEAQILVINTCAFIQLAKEEAIDTILEAVALKEEREIHHLMVTGCLVEGYREELQEEIPQVDLYLGTSELDVIVEAVKTLMEGEAFHRGPKRDYFDYNRSWPRFREFLPHPKTAYLRIGEGCDNCCSYCVIPSLRGPYRSRPIEAILHEAMQLADSGVRELILVAQDSGFYGLDLYRERRLTDLLEALSEIRGLHWIRVLYLNLSGITERLLETMKENEPILPYLDIPLQHSSPPILKAMNRGENGERLEERIHWIRETLPGVTLRTTIIVGFPGEREEDFQHLYSFVKKMTFDRLGVFTYSREEKTLAYHYPHQVPEEISRERRDSLMELQKGISYSKNRDLIGEDLEVLAQEVVEEDPTLLAGRSKKDAPEIDNSVFFTTSRKRRGLFYTVRITGASEYDLLGEEIL